MADGEKTIDATQYPDAFQYVSVTLGADTVDTTQSLDAYIMYCDRATVVDAAFISFTTVDASNDATFQLHYVPSGLQDTAGDTPVGPEGSGTAITSTTTSGATADASIAFTMTETANVVPAGTRIALKVAGTSDIEGVNIPLRIRTRRK